MPKGKWQPPEAGDAPAEVKSILKNVYAAYRDKHPGENPRTKTRGAKIAWGAVHNAGWSKDKEGKWVKKKKEMSDKEFAMAKDFVIFKTGHWNGEAFTEQDLDNMVKSYNTDEPAAIIIGHSSDYKGKTMIPAWGQIKGGLKRVGQNLIACGVEFHDQLAEWIKEGFFNQRSIELTKDNKRVLAVGMLGAMPAAVKGMPLMKEVFTESALQFSEFNEAKVIEFSEEETLEFMDVADAEDSAIADTFKTVAECCASFMTDIETLLNEGASREELIQPVWDLQTELLDELNLHSQFMKKVEQMDGNTEEMAEQRPGWKEFVQTIKQLFTKRKESEDMDKEREQELLATIAEKDAKIKEFADKAKVEADARLKVEADAKEAARVAAETLLQTEVKTFCDTAVKENRMTPAMRETDEKIMFDLARVSPVALKSFQEKYSKPIVPLGEMKIVGQNDKQDHRSQVFVGAEKYVKENPKEFDGMTAADAINRAVYMHQVGQIKFADSNQMKGA